MVSFALCNQPKIRSCNSVLTLLIPSFTLPLSNGGSLNKSGLLLCVCDAFQKGIASPENWLAVVAVTLAGLIPSLGTVKVMVVNLA